MGNIWGGAASGHRWPVTLRHGDVSLVPLRRTQEWQWSQARQRNRKWLQPWEATMPPGAEAGPSSFGQFVGQMNKLARQGGALPWIIRYGPNRNAPLVGQVTVSGITGGSAGWAQIGYWVDQDFAGRGIIPTAVALASDYCWQVMNLHRIEIAIRPENKASLRVVAKLGFRYEGSRPRYLHIGGEWRDHEVFALNAEEVPGGLLARWEASEK